MPSINGFDIAFGILALVFIVVGAWRGLINEAIRFVAVLAGFSSAILWYQDLYPYLDILPFSPPTRTALSFIAVFVGVAALILAVGWIFRKVIHLTVLGWIDRLFGALLGLFKALLIVWVLVLSINSSPFTGVRSALKPSKVYTLLTSLPPDLKIPYFAAKPSSLDDVLGQPGRILEETGTRIKELRHKVDSAKAHYGSK